MILLCHLDISYGTPGDLPGDFTEIKMHGIIVLAAILLT